MTKVAKSGAKVRIVKSMSDVGLSKHHSRVQPLALS